MVGIFDRMAHYAPFLNEKGREELVVAIQQYRRQYADRWLVEFEANNPDLFEMVDLIANNDFPQAWEKLNARVEDWIEEEPNTFKRIGLRATAGIFVGNAKPDIERLHTAIRAEIDRPRF